MAQSGSRTLIVDTDMRRPRLHRAFGVSNDKGLSSTIVGESTLDDAIQATDAQDLDVLVCGPIPPNPAELLHTAAFKHIVEQLSERYERVIFDSPPVGAVTDPVVLGTHLDGAVVVLKAQRTTKDAATQAMRTLKDANVHIFGAVLNDVDLNSKRYGSGYYAYYRKYGYYYGEKPATGEA
jgi:succinoglycan biosynthesis transport protein ExoP